MVGWIKVLFQALIYLNNKLVGLIALHARLRTPSEVRSAMMWKSWEISADLILTMDHCAMLRENAKPQHA